MEASIKQLLLQEAWEMNLYRSWWGLPLGPHTPATELVWKVEGSLVTWPVRLTSCVTEPTEYP